MKKMSCAVSGKLCGVPPLVPADDTPRNRIAAQCNHAMEVHRAGPTDAWQAGMDYDFTEASKWAAEVRAEAVDAGS